jgi:hypothetical protein
MKSEVFNLYPKVVIMGKKTFMMVKYFVPLKEMTPTTVEKR